MERKNRRQQRWWESVRAAVTAKGRGSVEGGMGLGSRGGGRGDRRMQEEILVLFFSTF